MSAQAVEEASAAAGQLLEILDPCFDRHWPEPEASRIEELFAAGTRLRDAADTDVAREALTTARAALKGMFRAR